MYVDNVASISHSNKQTQQNPSDTHEECDATESEIGVDELNMVHTRCTIEKQKDDVFAVGFGNLLLECGHFRRELCGWIVSNFDTKSSSLHIHRKTIGIDSSCFAHVMGIPDHGAPIHIHGAVPNLGYWASKFSITSRGFDVKHIEDRLQVIKTSDDEFKWEPPVVDKSLPPIVSWTNVKIKKCLLRLRNEGGVSSNKVPVGEMVTKLLHGGNCQVNPTSSVGGHGTSYVIDSEVGTGNNAKPNIVVSEIQLIRVEIQDLKSKLIWLDEFDDLKRKCEEKCSLFREEDKEHSSVKKNIHLFDEKDKEHGRLHVMNPNQEEDLPIDDHLDDDRDGSNDDDDILNVKVPKYIPSLLDEIISAVVEYLTTMMKRSRSPLWWYLTSYFAVVVMGIHPSWRNLLVDLRIHICSISVDVNKKCANCVVSSIFQMYALDIVLSTEIAIDFQSTFLFSSFTITTFEAPEQENCFDCGLFVCMFMDDNYPSPNQMATVFIITQPSYM
ncbi:hypothetical protein EZV62_027516 [Acer yangbiense]|uniref:Ubiquitin-like protease family profile domain-containing protein n=1 Tax=Acer yangbiense TaxID=1000413 RepID=A0A5C7GV54_9ROSI|nr:hypothetical protein EZV62_027516 [Acer yangbiense]